MALGTDSNHRAQCLEVQWQGVRWWRVVRLVTEVYSQKCVTTRNFQRVSKTSSWECEVGEVKIQMCEAADGSRESRHGEARPRRERKYLVRYPEWTSGASSTSGTSGYGIKLPYLYTLLGWLDVLYLTTICTLGA